MPTQLSTTDLNDILNGSCILGSGGGGPLTIGQQLLSDLEKLGKPVYLATPEEVDDTATMACVAGIGSPDAAAKDGFPYQVTVQAFSKLNALQKAATKQNFSYVLPAEIGAGNSFVPLIVAAVQGLPVVDAASARRAIPSLTMDTYATLPISPIVLTSTGDHQITLELPDASAAEGPLRAILSNSPFTSIAGIALYPMTGATMKQAAIPNTMTYALKLGRALRLAKANHKDPVQAVCQYLNGYVLFTGKIIPASSEQTTGGFDFGVTKFKALQGESELWVFNQNENLIAWNTAVPHPQVIGPDLICYLTTDGQPFSNADLSLAKDKEVAVIGVPADARFRNDAQVLAAFRKAIGGLGYPGPYVYIEQLREYAPTETYAVVSAPAPARETPQPLAPGKE